jgi:two-component system cell cycle response regulator
MSLHRRLTVFFIAIVILPLAAAAFVVQRFVVSEIKQRALITLDPALNASVVLYNDRTHALDDRVWAAIGSTPSFARLLESRNSTEIDQYLQRRLAGERGLDFLVVLDDKRQPLGFAQTPPSFVPGVATPTEEEVLSGDTAEALVLTPEIPIRVSGEGVAGHVIGGFWIDKGLLVPAAQGGVQMAVVVGNQVMASTAKLDGPERLSVQHGSSFETDIGSEGLGEARRLSDSVSVVAWTPTSPISERANLVRTAMIGLMLVALSATAVLAYKLARLVTQDLEELTEGARAVAEGRFDHRVPIRSRDEVGQLAVVFNEMAERLSHTIGELSSSRDQLQRAIRRVGDTLRSTHDMRQILEAILHTALDAVGADAANFWTFTPTREEVYPAIGIGTDADEFQRLKVGEGIAGLVAERGIQMTLPLPGGPRPGHGELDYPVVMALPIHSADRIYGVFTLYRKDAKRRFSTKDVETVEFLAEQGSVALENVALHEEANRLSLTDGLTGIYNRRYLQMQFRQVLATALRFNRPFSVLILDLDDFKQVNDTFGHQRGDSILIEFAHRVTQSLREVDTFSRYGGEEFVCLLSETNIPGAMTTAEKILDSVRAEAFGGTGEVPVELTVSIGIAAYPQHGDSFRTLIKSADDALYRAKREGKDRVVISNEPPQPGLKVAT